MKAKPEVYIPPVIPIADIDFCVSEKKIFEFKLTD